MPSFEAPFSGNSGNRNFTFIFTINSTGTDTANNRSTVNFAIDVRSNGGSPTYSFSSSNRVGATVDGQGSQIFSTLDFRNRPAGTTFRVYENNITVNHNSDGTKTVNYNATGSYSVFGSASVTGSFQLPTIPRAPSTPATVTASVPVARTIAVSWDASSGGAGLDDYTLQRRENNGNYITIATTTARNFTDSNLNPRSTYRYQVRGNGPGGSSGFRQSQTRTIAPAASPPVTTATRTLRTVEVTMTEPSVIDNTTNIVSYTTERRQNNGAWGDQRTTTDLNNRSITYTDLPSETNQQFRGRADTNRTSSNFSESQTLFIPGLPDPPARVDADRHGSSILVVLIPGGDGGAPILSYTVERRTSENFGTSWSEWGDPVIADGAERIYLYDSLELQKTYQFRALATNEEGNSEQFTESESVYLPAIMRIYDNGQFRLPGDYKRYNEVAGAWVGLSISRRYFNGQWVELE